MIRLPSKGLNAEILRLAVPNILSNISIPLISAVDTALMGHLSIQHLGAIGIGSMIFNFIYWNFGFLRMGTTGMIAQEVGRNNKLAIASIGVRSIIIALCISFILMLSAPLILGLSLYAFNASAEMSPIISEYFSIRIWAAPATICLYVLMGWLFGMQNAIYPLIITVVINVTNVVLSYWLVIHQDLEIRGAAIGTVVAQYIGILLAIMLITHKYKNHFKINLKKIKGELQEWLSLFRVNGYLFIRTICLTLAFAFFYAQSSAQGALVLATHVVMLQFLNWISYGIDGFAFASESLVGKYFGAQEWNNLEEIIRYIFIWGFGLATCYSLFFFFFETSFIQIFTNDTDVITQMKSFRTSLILLPVLGFLCYLWDGIYIGLAEVKWMMVTMIGSLVVYLFLFVTLVESGIISLWYLLISFLVVRGVLQTGIWHLKIKKSIIPSNFSN